MVGEKLNGRRRRTADDEAAAVEAFGILGVCLVKVRLMMFNWDKINNLNNLSSYFLISLDQLRL